VPEEAAVSSPGPGGGPLLPRLDSQVPRPAEGQGGPPGEEVHHGDQQVDPLIHSILAFLYP